MGLFLIGKWSWIISELEILFYLSGACEKRGFLTLSTLFIGCSAPCLWTWNCEPNPTSALFLPPPTHPRSASHPGPWSSVFHLRVSLPWCTEGVKWVLSIPSIAKELWFPPAGTGTTSSSRRRGCFPRNWLHGCWRGLEVSEGCRRFRVLCSCYNQSIACGCSWAN